MAAFSYYLFGQCECCTFMADDDNDNGHNNNRKYHPKRRLGDGWIEGVWWTQYPPF